MSAEDERIWTDEDGIRCTDIPTKDGYFERSQRGTPRSIPCNVCGRPIEDERYYVLMGHGGGIALHLEDVPEDMDERYALPGFMGGKPVGPTCKDELPDGFVGDREAN